MNPIPFLDKTKAYNAFEAFVLPGIRNAISGNHVKGGDLHIVALDPNIRYENGRPLPILFEYSFGVEAEWKWPYRKYAYGKAMISWRTGLSSRDVIMTKPHMLLPGDPLYWGSAIVDGVISAVSGVQPYFDEMFARMNSAALCAEATHYATLLASDPDAPDFLPTV